MFKPKLSRKPNWLQALAQDQLRALRQMCSAAFGDDAPHVEVYDGDTSQVSFSNCQTINTVKHAGKPPGGTAFCAPLSIPSKPNATKALCLSEHLGQSQRCNLLTAHAIA